MPRRLLSHDPSEVRISSTAIAEPGSGVHRSSMPERNRMALMMFLSGISVLPFDGTAALEYGDIRHAPRSHGLVIGANDMPVAAHARSLGLVLVTHNTREFARVDRLEL